MKTRGLKLALGLPLGLIAVYQLIIVLQTPSTERLKNLSQRLDEINKAREALPAREFKSGNFIGKHLREDPHVNLQISIIFVWPWM